MKSVPKWQIVKRPTQVSDVYSGFPFTANPSSTLPFGVPAMDKAARPFHLVLLEQVTPLY